jgi:ankyrin repeat protein
MNQLIIYSFYRKKDLAKCILVSSLVGCVEIIKLLIDNSQFELWHILTNNKNIAFLTACCYGYLEIVKLLIEYSR